MTSYDYDGSLQLGDDDCRHERGRPQTTQYIYGTAVSDNGAVASPEIYDNDLLRAVIYADSGPTPRSPTARTGHDRPAPTTSRTRMTFRAK